MVCTLKRFRSFDRQIKTVLKTYPNSAKAIEKEISGLADNPEKGIVYPGFAPFKVRKIRIGLKAYRLSSSEGLRLIFLHLPDKFLVAPLVIYKKGTLASEQQAKELIINGLKDILAEIKREELPPN